MALIIVPCLMPFLEHVHCSLYVAPTLLDVAYNHLQGFVPKTGMNLPSLVLTADTTSYHVLKPGESTRLGVSRIRMAIQMQPLLHSFTLWPKALVPLYWRDMFFFFMRAA